MSKKQKKQKPEKKPEHRILWNVRGKDIDEVVFMKPGMVHIEQMHPRQWWIGVYFDDQGTRWSGHFTCDSRGRMTFSQQDCDIEWDRDDTHERTRR